VWKPLPLFPFAELPFVAVIIAIYRPLQSLTSDYTPQMAAAGLPGASGRTTPRTWTAAAERLACVTEKNCIGKAGRESNRIFVVTMIGGHAFPQEENENEATVRHK